MNDLRRFQIIKLGEVFKNIPIWAGFYGPHEKRCFYWMSNDSCSCATPPAFASNISLGVTR